MDFNISHDKYGIYGTEYRAPILKKEGCKKVDIMCVIVDEKLKQCHTYIFDVKRNISGFNVDDDLNQLRHKEVKRIKEFIKPIDDSLAIKESFMLFLKRDKTIEKESVGIATREFNVDKLNALSERLYNFCNNNKSNNVNKLIAFKYMKEMLPIEKDAEIIELFSERKINLSGKIYDLEVYILENNKNGKDYIYELEII